MLLHRDENEGCNIDETRFAWWGNNKKSGTPLERNEEIRILEENAEGSDLLSFIAWDSLNLRRDESCLIIRMSFRGNFVPGITSFSL